MNEPTTIEFCFSELIDVNDDFDLMMLNVFQARDDLYRYAGIQLIEEVNINSSFLSTLCRHHFAIIREAYKMVDTLFKTPKYRSKIEGMYNYNLMLLNWDHINIDVTFWNKMRKYRNELFHYCEIKNYKKVLAIQHIENTSLHIGDTMGNTYYDFCDEISFAYLLYVLDEKNLKYNKIENFRRILKLLSEKGVELINLLDLIIDGFLATKKINGTPI